MRFPRVFLFLLLLAPLASVAYDPHAAIGKKLSDELNWTGDYSVTYIPVGGKNYGLISINGTDTFAVALNGENVTVVTDPAVVDGILDSRSGEANLGIVDAIRGDILVFNGSRNAERDCKTGLGLEGAPCSDRDSCLRSCTRSQYLCLPMAQGIGWPFVDEMVSFSTATLKIELDLAEFSTGLDSFSSGKTDSLPSNGLLTDIESRISAIKKNKLFAEYSAAGGGYEFCNAISYRTDALQNAKKKINILAAALNSGDSNITRDRIINETLERIGAIEAARKLDFGLAEEIKANASTEFALAYGLAVNSSQIVVSSDLDEKIVALNASLNRILSSENSSVAIEEYASFTNRSREIGGLVKSIFKKFDTLAQQSNLCSSVLGKAEGLVKSHEGKSKLDELRKRKNELDLLMEPPVEERQMSRVIADLNSIRNQAEVLMLQEAEVEGGGFDYALAGTAVAAIAIGGGAFWLWKNKKLRLPLGAGKQAPKEEKAKEPGNAEAVAKAPGAKKQEKAGAREEPKPEQTHAKAARPEIKLKGRLSLRGGTYRATIKTSVRDRGGNPVPDGTAVTFRADSGLITPSAVTKDGVVYARMAFKKKPGSVSVVAKAQGIERTAEITFA